MRRTVALIEPGNPSNFRVQQRFITVDVLRRGIEPVGEESEMQLAFRARKVVDLQMLNLFLDQAAAVVSIVVHVTSVRR